MSIKLVMVEVRRTDEHVLICFADQSLTLTPKEAIGIADELKEFAEKIESAKVPA